MFHKVRNQNRKDIKNYIEIYIRSNIDDISKKKKKIYKKFKKKYSWTRHFSSTFEKPDIIIKMILQKVLKF